MIIAVVLACPLLGRGDLVAFRTGTSSGIVNFGGEDYTFSSYNNSKWGYSSGYTVGAPIVSTVINVGGLASNDNANKGWIGFSDIIGSNAGQIPAGATINSAVLQMRGYSSSGVNMNLVLHRVVNEANDWYATSPSWSYLNQPTTAGWVDASDAVVSKMHLAASGTTESGAVVLAADSAAFFTVDVTGSLSSWAVSETGDNKNMGWGVSADVNAGVAISSPSASAIYRPVLYVDYTAPVAIPEPATMTLMVMSLLGLLVHRHRTCG